MRAALVLIGVVACGDNIRIVDPNAAISGSRLRIVHHVFDDGARQLETDYLRDAARDEDCSPTSWSDGGSRCTPPTQPAVFVDNDCSTLLGKAPRGTTPAYFHREFVLQRQPMVSRLYTATDRVAAPLLVWQLLDNACIGPVDADPNADYFALGPELTSEEFARLHIVDVEATSRLAYSLYTSDDGMQIPIARAQLDTLLDVDCLPFALDGSTSATCVPDVPVAEYYDDDACGEPVLAIRSGDAMPSFVQYADANACPAYARIGDAIALPSPHRRTAAGCVAAIASNDERFFAIGDAVAFAHLSRHRRDEGRRIERIELVDGDRIFEDTHLYDTALGIECALVATADGVRCLPRSSLLAPEREPMYRDELCSDELSLVLVPATRCTLPSHLVDDGVRPLLRYTGAIYHLSTGDRCLPYTVPGSAQSYELGPALPLSTFAAATAMAD
jgi:hypothetical protein